MQITKEHILQAVTGISTTFRTLEPEEGTYRVGSQMYLTMSVDANRANSIEVYTPVTGDDTFEDTYRVLLDTALEQAVRKCNVILNMQEGDALKNNPLFKRALAAAENDVLRREFLADTGPVL